VITSARILLALILGLIKMNLASLVHGDEDAYYEVKVSVCDHLTSGAF
jgi:hypothetical protein